MGSSTSKSAQKRTTIENFDEDQNQSDPDRILVKREKTDVIAFPDQSTIDRELLSYDGQLYSMFDDDDKGKSASNGQKKDSDKQKVAEANSKLRQNDHFDDHRNRSPQFNAYDRHQEKPSHGKNGVRFGSEPEIIPDLLDVSGRTDEKRLTHAASSNNIASLNKRSMLKNARVVGSSPNFTELSPRIGTPTTNRFERDSHGVAYMSMNSPDLLPPTLKPHSPYVKQTMKYVDEHFGIDDRNSVSLSDPEDYRIKSASPLPSQRASLPTLFHKQGNSDWYSKRPGGHPSHAKSLEQSDGLSPMSSKLSNSSSGSSFKPKAKVVGGQGKPKKPWEPYTNDPFSHRDNVYKGIAFINSRPRRQDFPT